MTTRRFEMTEDGSAKFWEIRVEGKGVTVSFGRIGTAGQTKTKEHASEAAAEAEAKKLVTEKTKKGYAEVGAASAPATSTPAEPAPAKPAKRAKKGSAPPSRLRAERHALLALAEKFFEAPPFGEVSAVEGTPEMVVHYEASPQGDAWRAFFREVEWLFAEADGGLVGCWHRGVDACVVVYLDNEGSLSITGPTLIDHFVARNAEGIAEVSAAAKAASLAAPLGEIERAVFVASQPRPSARLDALIAEQKFAGKAVVRPLDRSPVCVPLRDGRVVVISSEDSETSPNDYDAHVVFVFDPRALRFVRVKDTPLRCYLGFRAAGVLADGRAAFVALADTTRVIAYDADADAWTAGAVLAQKIERAGVLVLADGRVLVVGGERGYPVKSASVYVYDPLRDAWTELAGKLAVPRASPALIEIEPGVVLAGGGDTRPDAHHRTDSDACDRIELANGAVSALPSAPVALPRPSALALDETRVLFTSQNGVAAIFDRSNATWGAKIDGATGNVPVRDPRGVLLFGGGQQVALVEGASARVVGQTRLPRNVESCAVALEGGRVLVLGGDLFNNLASEPELWEPATGEGGALPGLEKKLEKQARDLERYRAKQKR